MIEGGIHFNEHIGKGLVNEHGNNSVNNAFYECEGEIEDNKGFNEIVGSGENGLIHTDDNIHITAGPELSISGVNNEVIDNDT